MNSHNILHINIRLQEGGAAKVALQLHLGLLQRGINSTYGYGYSKGADDSPVAEGIPNVFRITNKSVVIGNYLSHSAFGIDQFIPSLKFREELISKIKKSSIVHLHAIHSYFLPFTWLFNILLELNKPVIWTAHDHWMITGRCAFLNGCTNWKSHCGSCLTRSNYPPSLIDLSRSQLRNKSQLIQKLAANLKVISPSRHLADDIKSQYPNLEVSIIPNAVDFEMQEGEKIDFKHAKLLDYHTSKLKLVVIANDLSYQGKTNRILINRIADFNDLNIITIGKNSPFFGVNFTNLGEITDRSELLKIFTECDALIFSSQVDNYPLVIGEAHYCGLPVFATPSKASVECMALVGGHPLSEQQIMEAIKFRNLFGQYELVENSTELKKLSRQYLDTDTMIGRYIEAYDQIHSRMNGKL